MNSESTIIGNGRYELSTLLGRGGMAEVTQGTAGRRHQADEGRAIHQIIIQIAIASLAEVHPVNACAIPPP